MTGQARKRGPRGDITAHHLLTAADRLLRTGGSEALSLRGVAREAGVTPNTLYTYFTDMADLRNRLGDRFLSGLDLSLLTGATPAVSLRRFLVHVLDVFAASPGHVELLAAQRIAGVGAFALNEALLTFFMSTGHSQERAAGITRFVTEWVHGRLLLSPSNSGSATFQTALSDIDLKRFPRTAATLTTPDDEAALDLLIAAFTT